MGPVGPAGRGRVDLRDDDSATWQPSAWAGTPPPSSPPLYEPPRYGVAPVPGANGRPPSAATPPPATPPPDRGAGWRAALLGAVVGAVVAALLAGGLVLALDDDRSSTPVGAPVAPLTGEADIRAVLAKAQPAVVTIETGQMSLGSAFGGTGSGVVISPDGLVLTNDHVISGADTIDVTLFDGRVVAAELVGSFPDADVALIQLEGVADLTPAELGMSSSLQIGDEVLAIGNASGLGGTPSVTHGIVSGLDRAIEAQGTLLEGLIQTDTAINQGNSGGPLVNAAGQVVGINTAIVRDAENIGFAIAIDTIKPLIEKIKAGQGAVTQHTVFLGVSTAELAGVPPELRTSYGVVADTGAFVLAVTTGSAAEVAGLEVGDVIVEMDGRPVSNPTEVGEIVTEHEPGDVIDIVVERGGERRSLTATLSTRAATGD